MAGTLSDVFKHISHFRRSGHEIGRKVGDMLEVLTLAAIYNQPELKTRLLVEPKIMGFSGAAHKVEFAIQTEVDADGNWRRGGNVDDPERLLAFIECKKVGVEQTVNAKFKGVCEKHNNESFIIPFNHAFEFQFSPRGMRKVQYSFTLEDSHNLTIFRKIDDVTEELFCDLVERDYRLIFTYGENGETDLLVNNQSLREIPYKLRGCKILEIHNLQNSICIGKLNDCLQGPQTPEKAKQASFVALDVRKKVHGSFDLRPAETACISVLIMTEFSHWEAKSQNMITACIDQNLIVPDDIIVYALSEFERTFGETFTQKITKDLFLLDDDVRQLALAVLNRYQGKIFRSINDSSLKKIIYANGNILFEV